MCQPRHTRVVRHLKQSLEFSRRRSAWSHLPRAACLTSKFGCGEARGIIRLKGLSRSFWPWSLPLWESSEDSPSHGQALEAGRGWVFISHDVTKGYLSNINNRLSKSVVRSMVHILVSTGSVNGWLSPNNGIVMVGALGEADDWDIPHPSLWVLNSSHSRYYHRQAVGGKSVLTAWNLSCGTVSAYFLYMRFVLGSSRPSLNSENHLNARELILKSLQHKFRVA